MITFNPITGIKKRSSDFESDKKTKTMQHPSRRSIKMQTLVEIFVNETECLKVKINCKI